MVLKKILLISGFILIFSSAFAQPDPGDDPDVPLDGGIALLLASGATLGIKKIHDQRKLQKESK